MKIRPRLLALVLAALPLAAAAQTHTQWIARTLHSWPTEEPTRFTGGSLWCVNPHKEPVKVTGTFYFQDKEPVTKTWEVPAQDKRTFGLAAVAGLDEIVGAKVESARRIQVQFTSEIVKNPKPTPSEKPKPGAKQPEVVALVSYLATRSLGTDFLLGDACTSGKPADGPKRASFEQQYFTIINPTDAPITGTITGYFKNSDVADVPVTVPARRILHVEAAQLGLGNRISYDVGRLNSMKLTFAAPVAVLQTRALLKNTGGDLARLPLIESFTWMMDGSQ